MNPDDLTWQKCRALLHTLYGARLHGIVLYGSCARGTAAPESDIDLMVLLEGPVDVAQEIRRMWEVLYPLQLESDRLFSVVPVDVALYHRGEYALYRQAKAEGMALWKASRREIVERWQRAQEALRATPTLLVAGFPDFSAARAYFAAFSAASTLLLAEGKTCGSHRGVVALIHRDYVRSGRLSVAMGRSLSTLSDLRSVRDYGGAAHVSHAEANKALLEAEQFIDAVRSLLPAEIFNAAADRQANPDVREQER